MERSCFLPAAQSNEVVMLMSEVAFNMPDTEALMEYVRAYAPTVLVWCAIALAASLALRLVLMLFHKRSALLRAVNWLALVGGVAALGGYWILTGEVPNVVDDAYRALSGVQLSAPEQLAQVSMTGIIILAAGAVAAFLSGPLSRMFSKGEGAGDVEIVIKTIGWLVCVLGALVTFGVI